MLEVVYTVTRLTSEGPSEVYRGTLRYTAEYAFNAEQNALLHASSTTGKRTYNDLLAIRKNGRTEAK